MNKRILFISDTIIMPLERGNRKRAYNLINMMRERGCEVDFLFLHTYPEEDPALTKEFIGEEHFITFVNKKRTFGVFLKRKVRYILELLHIPGLFKYFSVDEKISPDIVKFMQDLTAKKHYDVVWCEYEYVSKALLGVPEETVKVIDTVNAFAFKRQMYEAVGYKNYEYAVTKEEEAKALRRADFVVAIQEAEEAFFRSILDDSIKCCTIGENMPVSKAHVTKSNVILFLGSYYVVNREGVKHFINKILPLIKKSGVDYEFWLAGSICKHIPDSDEYTKLGYVEDIDETYDKARLVVNPVHVGTGLNIKTIEAVSKAKPLVTHEIGVRGLSMSKPFALVSDDDEQYANDIIKLLKDDALCQKLSENAVTFMDEYKAKNIAAFESIINYKKN